MRDKKKILVVEDDCMVMKSITELLCKAGFDACGVSAGTDAIREARASQPDLILCDIWLPDIDGYGVLQQIRFFPTTAGIRFAFISARNQENHIQSALAMGADGYLTKPFNVSTLLHLVRQLLEPGL